MVTSIGIRAKPKEIFYSVCSEEPGRIELISCSKLIIPMSLAFPEKLKFVRNTFLDIIYEFQITRAGIRIAESLAERKSCDRISLEAVIQELLASGAIPKLDTL